MSRGGLGKWRWEDGRQQGQLLGEGKGRVVGERPYYNYPAYVSHSMDRTLFIPPPLSLRRMGNLVRVQLQAHFQPLFISLPRKHIPQCSSVPVRPRPRPLARPLAPARVVYTPLTPLPRRSLRLAPYRPRRLENFGDSVREGADRAVHRGEWDGPDFGRGADQGGSGGGEG